MNDIINAVTTDGFDELAQVGGVRAFRMRRDLGVTRIADVAELSTDELQQVTSIGPVRAAQIKGSAQGFLQRYESVLEAQEREFTKDARIALVVPRSTDGSYPDASSVLDEAGLDEDEQVSLINDAVEATGVDPVEEDVRIITHDGTPWIVDEWYDQVVLESFDGGEATTERRVVDTPWSKYDDGVKYKAAQDRNEEMVRMADCVVIVADGKYSKNLREECERQGTQWETTYDVSMSSGSAADPGVDERCGDRSQSEGEKRLMDWVPSVDREFEFRGWEIDDVETWARSATKYTGVGAEHVDSHPPHIEDDDEVENEDGLSVEQTDSSREPEEVDPSPRAGSHLDFEDDETQLTMEPADSLDEESRIDKDDLEDGDPGGGKKDEYVETPGLV